jgi:hypothetical protein
MLSYHKLKDRPRDFLAATGWTPEEFQKLLPAFQAAYDTLYPSAPTRAGKLRQRRAGGGAQGVLHRCEDQLLCILVYQQTNPLHTRHAWQFDVSQPHANDWRHPLLPVLPHAFAAWGLAPERAARRLPTRPALREGAPEAALDGTARCRQRPTDAQWPQEQYSGKKQTPTDTNRLWVNERTGHVVSLGPTVAGTMHDKTAAEEAKIVDPTHAPLDQDPGWQGSEPARVRTTQLPKSPKTKSWAWGIASCIG